MVATIDIFKMCVYEAKKTTCKHSFRLTTALNSNIRVLLANSTPSCLIKVKGAHHLVYAYFLKAPTVVDRDEATRTVKISTM